MRRGNLHFGTLVDPLGSGADGNANGKVDAADYTIWRNNLSTGSGSASEGQRAESSPTSLVSVR